MKQEQGLYTTDNATIKDKVDKTGLTGVFSKKLA